MENDDEKIRQLRTRSLCAVLRLRLTTEELADSMSKLKETFEKLSQSIKPVLEYHEIRNEEDFERAIQEAQESGDLDKKDGQDPAA